MADDGLICLVYVSCAAQPMGDDDLLALLRHARSSNERAGITGLLLYKAGHFMQALEGGRSAVQALFRRICMDQRHRNVVTLIKFAPQGRAFEGWTMGFANVDQIPAGDRAGFNPFLNQDFVPDAWTQAPHQAMRLLLSFRDRDTLVQTSG